MKVKLRKYESVSRRLKNRDIWLGRERLAKLEVFLCACEAYPGFEGEKAYVFGRPGKAKLIVHEEVEQMLEALALLPGGLPEFVEAATKADVGRFLIDHGDEEIDTAELWFGCSNDSRYAKQVYDALTIFYYHREVNEHQNHPCPGAVGHFQGPGPPQGADRTAGTEAAEVCRDQGTGGPAGRGHEG